MQQALERAQQALYGLATADALGALFEFSHGQLSRRISERIVPEMQWHWSDDTHIALMIASGATTASSERFSAYHACAPRSDSRHDRRCGCRCAGLAATRSGLPCATHTSWRCDRARTREHRQRATVDCAKPIERFRGTGRDCFGKRQPNLCTGYGSFCVMVRCNAT